MVLLPTNKQCRRLVYLATSMLFGIVLFWSIQYLELGLTHLNQLPIRVEERVQQWDWKDKPNEIACRAPFDSLSSKAPIPNVVHTILLPREGEETELSFSGFLAIKSTLVRLNATEVKIHSYGINTQNYWWKQIENHVTLVLHDRYKLKGPNNLPIYNFALAHQADFLRLDILRHEGGIYLDADVYPVKPFTDLLHNPRDTILGHEGGNRYGLCNAVIVARPASEFLAKWWATYTSFTSQVWNKHSVQIPKQLSVRYPELICLLSPTVFFWPTWAKSHIQYMHELISTDETAELKANLTKYGGAMYENQLAYHAWGALTSEYLLDLTPEDLLDRDTRFNLLIRDVYTTPI